MERTLAIIKPDGLEYTYEILKRIGAVGYSVEEMKVTKLTLQDVEQFYNEHVGKPFFAAHADHMTDKEVIVMILQGEGAILGWRALLGATDPTKAEKGTIRGDMGTALPCNVCHGSDSSESAALEIEFFFPGESNVSTD